MLFQRSYRNHPCTPMYMYMYMCMWVHVKCMYLCDSTCILIKDLNFRLFVFHCSVMGVACFLM